MGEKKPELRIKIAALLDASVPVAKIAISLNISRQRVYAIARDMGYRFERVLKRPIG